MCHVGSGIRRRVLGNRAVDARPLTWPVAWYIVVAVLFPGSQAWAGAGGTIQITLQVKYEIYTAQVSLNPFSPAPREDGARDATSIRFQLPWPPTTGNVKVYNSKKALVRTLPFDQSRRDAAPEDSNWYFVDWDGRNESGGALPDDETCTCVIHAVGGDNNPAEMSVTVGVDREPPVIEGFQVGQGKAARTIAWTQSEAGRVWLRIYGGEGRIVREWTMDRAQGEQSQSWDGTDWRGAALKSGTYTAKIFMRDAALNPSQTHTTDVVITSTKVAPKGNTN